MFAEHNVLASSMQGFIAQCESCPDFVLSYGTVLFHCTLEELHFLEERVQKESSLPRSTLCPCTKGYLFRLSAENSIRLLLSRRELEELHQLICEAILVFKAKHIIDSEE